MLSWRPWTIVARSWLWQLDDEAVLPCLGPAMSGIGNGICCQHFSQALSCWNGPIMPSGTTCQHLQQDCPVAVDSLSMNPADFTVEEAKSV